MENIDDNLTESLNPAKLLLEDIFELHSMESNCANWVLDNFETESPRYYLLQRIHSLMLALQINDKGVSAIFDGEIMKQLEIDLDLLIERFPGLLPHKINVKGLEYGISKDGWSLFFERLFQHALFVSCTLKTNSGVMIASGLAGIGVDYTEALNVGIYEQTREEFDILVYLLNPSEWQITLLELQEKFNYPSIDMDQLMFDWF